MSRIGIQPSLSWLREGQSTVSWMNGQTELPTSLTRAEVRMSLGMFLSCSTWSSGAEVPIIHVVSEHLQIELRKVFSSQREFWLEASAPVYHEQHSKSTGECVTNAATLVLESDVGVEAVHVIVHGCQDECLQCQREHPPCLLLGWWSHRRFELGHSLGWSIKDFLRGYSWLSSTFGLPGVSDFT